MVEFLLVRGPVPLAYTSYGSLAVVYAEVCCYGGPFLYCCYTDSLATY